MAEGEAPRSLPQTIKKRWRAWLRALHRDTGYLAVGLTLIYAASGLAINHIADWDPNFVEVEKAHNVGPLPHDADKASAIVLKKISISQKPDDAYVTGDRLEIFLGERTLLAELRTGVVNDNYRKPRFLLRVANWLHYNRGKRAWTYISDVYAILLLYLAISGMFMLKGRLGLRWRGSVLVLLGVAVPVVYVLLSGGPGAH